MASDQIVSVSRYNRAARARTSRPANNQASRTNAPLAWPKGMRPRSSEGRRWRDLAEHYARQLGPEHMAREDVTTRLRTLLWLSIEVDRLQAARVCDDKPVPIHTVLHLTQEIRTLLVELGLTEPSSAPEQPALRDYVEARDEH